MQKEPPDPSAKLHEILQFQTSDGQDFEIPVEGCLGLLALGDIGLIAWRQKRQDEFHKQSVKLNENLLQE